MKLQLDEATKVHLYLISSSICLSMVSDNLWAVAVAVLWSCVSLKLIFPVQFPFFLDKLYNTPLKPMEE